MRRWRWGLWLLAVLVLLVPTGVFAQKGKGDPKSIGQGDAYILALMHRINEDLAAMELNIAVEEIELFTIGRGRPSNRIHQRPFRWVAGDDRRLAQGDDITYLVDQSDGDTTSGLTSGQTESAIDRAMSTWDSEKCLKKVNIVKRADPGYDPDIFDCLVTGNAADCGFPFFADIVHAGWLPRSFFDAATGLPDDVIAMSVTTVWLEYPGGPPSDINGDNRLDTAWYEVYYNDTFGTPGEPREDNPWGIDAPLPGVDVESIALHESGHSLGVGHFGPPPLAVMNPAYGGLRQSPYRIDHASMCTVWASWPK